MVDRRVEVLPEVVFLRVVAAFFAVLVAAFFATFLVTFLVAGFVAVLLRVAVALRAERFTAAVVERAEVVFFAARFVEVVTVFLTAFLVVFFAVFLLAFLVAMVLHTIQKK